MRIDIDGHKLYAQINLQGDASGCHAPNAISRVNVPSIDNLAQDGSHQAPAWGQGSFKT